jgi:hypothetical protein
MVSLYPLLFTHTLHHRRKNKRLSSFQGATPGRHIGSAFLNASASRMGHDSALVPRRKSLWYTLDKTDIDGVMKHQTA